MTMGRSLCEQSSGTGEMALLHQSAVFVIPQTPGAITASSPPQCTGRFVQQSRCLSRHFSQTTQIHSVDCAISSGSFGMVEGLICT